MTKTLTYYLWKGRPALYVGTVTDALFRRIKVEWHADTPPAIPSAH